MNATRLVGIVLGMAAGAGLGYFISQRTLFGSFRIELYVLAGAVIGAVLGLMVKPKDKPAGVSDEEERGDADDQQSKQTGPVATMLTPVLASLAVVGLALGAIALYSHLGSPSGNARSSQPGCSAGDAESSPAGDKLDEAKELAKTLYEATSLTSEDVIRQQIGQQVYLAGEIGGIERISIFFKDAKRQSRVDWEPEDEGYTHESTLWPKWHAGPQDLAKSPWLRRTSLFVLLPESDAAKLKRGQQYEGMFEVVAIRVDDPESYIYVKPAGP